jgi:DNA replication protein DnaC
MKSIQDLTKNFMADLKENMSAILQEKPKRTFTAEEIQEFDRRRKEEEEERIKKLQEQWDNNRLERMEIPTLYRDIQAENWKIPKENARILMDFWENPIEFILLCGNAGRGKTYSACCVLIAYWKSGGGDGLFVSASELYLKWKEKISEYGSAMSLANRLMEVKILVLDDLGIRTPTDAFLDFLYAIINGRMNERMGTIFTTNLTSTQMTEKLGEALSSRICSGKIIKFEGKDRRIKKDF